MEIKTEKEVRKEYLESVSKELFDTLKSKDITVAEAGVVMNELNQRIMTEARERKL